MSASTTNALSHQPLIQVLRSITDPRDRRGVRLDLPTVLFLAVTGEVRATVGVQRRLAEAARLGFDRAIVPLAGSQELRAVPGMQVLPVAHVGEAVGAALPQG